MTTRDDPTCERPVSPPGVATAQKVIEDLAECRLRRCGYPALGDVACECLGGVLTLRGCLPTYYLKQKAQEVVAEVEGVREIVNRIEVMSATRSDAAGPGPEATEGRGPTESG